MTSRWGVFGGTFDPVHFAHLAIAEQAREQLGLAAVEFVPAGQTVHKDARAVTPAEHRVAMLRLAVAGNPHFRVDPREVERGGPSYTVDTLAELAAAMPGAELVFILSAEAARELPGWRNPAQIVSLARLAIVPRLGYATPAPEWLAEQLGVTADRFELVDAPALGHSASDIRARIAAGRSIRYLVPEPVAAYIHEHGLYRAR